METKLKILTGAFASPKTEAAFQAFIVDGDRRANLRVLLFALPIFPFYAVLDYFALDNPDTAIAIRWMASTLCIVLFFTLRSSRTANYHEWITLAIVVILGFAMNLINYLFADPADSYYVGLIQGCVFVCFLLRISLPKTMLALGSLAIGFIPAAYMRPDTTEAGIQSVVLITMIGVCSIGAYLLQRFRRFDFQKVLIIEEQNNQLTKLLNAARADNDRKIAALSLLVHIVKTPLHQITGFSDLLLAASAEGGPKRDRTDASENVQYIRSATTELTQKVNALLNYHRLDEMEHQIDPGAVEANAVLDDFAQLLPEHIACRTDLCAPFAIDADEAVLRIAMTAMVSHFKVTNVGAETVTINAQRGLSDGLFVIIDDAQPLSEAQFAEDIKPLTAFAKDFSANGGELPMALRTAARAIEVLGGTFAHRRQAGGNCFTIILPLAGTQRKTRAA